VNVLSFEQCCAVCIRNEELVSEFNRLTGNNLKAMPARYALPDTYACVFEQDFKAVPVFLQFVQDFIWKPLQSTEW
jgi:hypothetical protein